MENLMKKFFRSSILTSSLLIAFGLLLCFQSELTILSISYLIGAILIAIGTLAIIKFIKNTNNIQKSQLDIVYGVVCIILGMIIIKNPEAIASIIPLIIGISIIISSATKLQYAFELKTNDNNLWKTTMIVAIVSTICGIILLFNPFKAASCFTKIVGIFIIIYAILDIFSTFTIKKHVKCFQDAIKNDIVEANIIEDTKEPEKKKKNVRRKKKKEEE